MVDTALTLITDALLDLGVLADEEIPTPSQGVGTLRKLNNLIDSWNIENLLDYGANSYVIPLVANQGVYTIGPSGNLNIPRPTTITKAFIRNPNGGQAFDTPLSILTNDQWADVPFKTQTVSYPNYGVWFDWTYPLIMAYVNPIPSTSIYSLVIWTEGLLGNLALNDVVSLPPGYKRALTANLAIELASSYSIQIPQALALIAQDSKAKIQMNNYQLNELKTPWSGYFDYRSNRFISR